MRRAIQATLLLAALVAAVGGCRLWEKVQEQQPSQLPAQRLADETVILEVAFVRYLPEEKFPASEIWNSIDEQVIPLARRKELWSQGLRLGVVGWQLPPAIKDKLDQQQLANQELAGGNVSKLQRLQVRLDKPATAICYPHRESIVLLRKSDVGGVIGKTYYSAQCQWEIRASPDSEGRVKLTLTPEILHGDAKKRYVGEDGGFRFENGQARELLADSRMQTQLNPGQTLVVTCTEPPLGLGQTFFTSDVEEGKETKILLIRLAQVSENSAFRSSDEN